jgi:hypothetical protein
VTQTETLDVRILAAWIDDPLQSPITVDVRIAAETHRIVGRWSMFGATAIGTDACRPFVLTRDGRMDFGEGRRAPDRYWRTDLLEREIVVGQRFAVEWSGGDSGTFVIEKVARLGSKTSGSA